MADSDNLYSRILKELCSFRLGSEGVEETLT